MSGLRQIRAEDAENILRIRRAAVMQTETSSLFYGPDILAAWTSVVSPEEIEKERRKIQDGGFFAMGMEEDGGQLVCFGRLDISCRNLMQLYCMPAFQRKGYGRAVLQSLEAEAVKAGLDMLELSASLVGKGFYLKMGYVPVREYDFILPGGVKMPCVIMNKRL